MVSSVLQGLQTAQAETPLCFERLDVHLQLHRGGATDREIFLSLGRSWSSRALGVEIQWWRFYFLAILALFTKLFKKSCRHDISWTMLNKYAPFCLKEYALVVFVGSTSKNRAEGL